MTPLPLAAPQLQFDSIAIGFFLCVMVFAALLIAGLFVFRRWRIRDGQPDPRRRRAQGTNRVVDAHRDETYVPPPHLAEREAETAPPSDHVPPLREPRPLLSCPRCNQVVLADETLAAGRIVCPTCGCKFYPPRGDVKES